MTFADDDVRAIGIRYVDDNAKLQDLQIILPVTVATKAGGAVHALLCRRSTEPGSNRWLVYYDRNADRMVAHEITAKLLGEWLQRVGG